MKKKIALIGAGQIGSRHLQSLWNHATAYEQHIFVYDVAQSSLNKCRELLGPETEPKQSEKSITFTSSFADLPQQLDLAIVATNAALRWQVMQDLLRHSAVSHLVLEKVLFQKLAEYDASETLIQEKKIHAYVNCPRRLYPYNLELKDILKGPLRIDVHGSQWGLACNGIHFIDLMHFFTDAMPVNVTTSELDQKIYPSKRSGYFEVMGCLEVEFSDGSRLSLSCSQEPNQAFEIHIRGEAADITIDETSGQITSKMPSAFTANIQTPYQSQLTGPLVERLLTSRSCGLTPFALSVQLHRPFVRDLGAFFQKFDGTAYRDLCPIT